MALGKNHIIYDISFDKPQLNHPNHPRRHDTAPELAAGQVDHPSWKNRPQPWSRRTAASQRFRSPAPQLGIAGKHFASFNQWESNGKPMGNHQQIEWESAATHSNPHPWHPRQRLKEGSTARRYALAKALQHQTGVQTNPPVGCGSARCHLTAEEFEEFREFGDPNGFWSACRSEFMKLSLNHAYVCLREFWIPIPSRVTPRLCISRGPWKCRQQALLAQCEDLGLQNCWSLWISTWRISIRKTQWMLMTYQCMFTIIIKKSTKEIVRNIIHKHVKNQTKSFNNSSKTTGTFANNYDKKQKQKRRAESRVFLSSSILIIGSHPF